MLGFCETCRDMVQCHVKDKQMIKNIRGKDIEYMGKVAFCNECKNEIFVPEIRDYNLEMLDKSFRKKEGLISVSDMELILERYDIGKRPLSLLLGWGEITFSRYLDGNIPTKQYSDTLQKVLNDPGYMRELLEKNKNKIADIAYKRCNNALLKIECEEDFPIRPGTKIDHVVNYLLKNSSDITPLALQKLLYYSQGFFKAFTGEYLFHDDCEAWVHGPVYREVYHGYKAYGYNPIEERGYKYADIALTEVEKEILDSIIRNFGCYSGKMLEDMTHTEAPWCNTRLGLKDDENSDRIIQKDLMARYFNDVKLKHNMLNTSDIMDYSRDLFNKLNS